jgi:hypothetical protein
MAEVRRYVGESTVDSCQLGKVMRVRWQKYDGLLQFVTQEYKCMIHVRTEDVRMYLVAFSYQCSR